MKRVLPLVLAASSAFAAQYVPGLVQAKLSGSANRTTDIATHATAHFVPGTLMTTVDNSRSLLNPYDGSSWNWPDNTTYAYAGQMFFEAGRTYRVGKHVDDSGYVTVGGTTVLENTAWESCAVGAFTPPETGWYDVDFRFGNGSGGAGVVGAVGNGFRWNTNGVDSFTEDSFTEANGWHPFFDPGDASLLRVKRSDQGYFGVSGFETDGGDLLVDVSFLGVPFAGASLAAFWGAADGGTTPSAWDASAAVSADVAAGDSDARVRIEGAAGARYVAFRLLGTLDGAMPYADWSVTFDLARATPAFVLVCGDPGYTNLPFIVSAAAVGADATSFRAALQLAPDASFASGVRSFPLALSGLGSEVAVATGLPTNSVWYARVIATNNLEQASTGDPIGPVRTLLPGVPEAEIAPLYAGFSHTTWTVSCPDFGAGGEAATLWLDVSKAGDFSDALSFGGVPAVAPPASAEIDAFGLENGTVYAVRGRVANDWGVEGVSAVSSAALREEPVEVREPGYVAGADAGEMVLSAEVDDVEPGATYSATLTVDGRTAGTWSDLDATGVLEASWRGVPGTSHRAEFTIFSSFGGRSWTRSYPFSFVVGARNVPLSAASAIDGLVFRVGDRATVGDGTAAAVLGDGIATLEGQTLTMKHPGFALLKAADGTEYGFGVYEAPADGGDAFLFDWSAGNPVGWKTAAWTNLTGNSARTYPDHADDVAMILNVTGDNYRYITVPSEGVTVGQLIVGMTRPFTLNHVSGTSSPLRFARTDGAAPRICLSRPASSGTGDVHFRFGEYDGDDGGNVLAVSFTGPALEVDFCGDTAAASAYARKVGIGFMFGRGKIAVGEGRTLRFRNGSRLVTDFANLSRGRLGSGIFGAGTVEVRDVAFDFQSENPDAYFDVGLFRSVEGFGPFDPADNNNTRYTTRFNVIPSVPVEILSARCPTNLNAQTTFRNYWPTGSTNAWLSPSVLLSGCNYDIPVSGEYAPHWDYWIGTNAAEKLTLRGHVGFYTYPAYGRDNTRDDEGVQRGRVTQILRVKDLERADRWSTAQANGFNFNRGSGTNDLRGTIAFDNWEEHVRRPPGVDPSDYDGTVYAIIPWMTVHCNDNNQVLTDTDWGQEQTFPGVREADGCIRLLQSLANNGSQTLKDRGPNDNFYFSNKTGFKLEDADRTLFSLVYCTQETPPYVNNLYLDSAKGGHKLFITSGAMAITRQNKWLGQPEDMTRNGRIVLQGSPAYLHVASGLYSKVSGSTDVDYNMCWVPLDAADDLVKGGAGSIGLAGDQRGIRGTLVVNGGELYLGYPAYKKNGWLYNYGHENRGWPMHGCATDCDFRVRGGAVLALASNGYQGVDSDGNDVDAPVIATGSRGDPRTIVLERSGNAEGGIYVADGVSAAVWEAFYQTEDGEEVSFARGTWGSSESTAEHVDDVHFAGPGVLAVLHDRNARPTIMVLR